MCCGKIDTPDPVSTIILMVQVCVGTVGVAVIKVPIGALSSVWQSFTLRTFTSGKPTSLIDFDADLHTFEKCPAIPQVLHLQSLAG